MSMSDPIADFLTRIRNGYKPRKDGSTFPVAMKKRIAYVLKEEKYIESFFFISESSNKEKLEYFLNTITMVNP